MSICLSIHQIILVYLSVCQIILICLSISIYLFVCLSFNLSLCPSIHSFKSSLAHRLQHLCIFNMKLCKSKRLEKRKGSFLLCLHGFPANLAEGWLQSGCTIDLCCFSRVNLWHQKLWLGFIIGSSGSKQTFLSQAWCGASGPSERVGSSLCQCVQSAQHGVEWGPITAHGHYGVSHVGPEYFQLAIPTQSQETREKLAYNI